MRIDGLCKGVVTVEVYEVLPSTREARLRGDLLELKASSDENTAWFSAGSMRSKRVEYETIVDTLLWQLRSYSEKAGLSKAELKRRMVRMGVLSK